MKHKWHKEIKAWADGKTIQGRWNATMKYVKHDWHDCSGLIDWNFPAHDYRIKPTEKVMEQHKWHKEIKAWANGEKIQTRQMFEGKWLDWKRDGCPDWYVYEGREYRIKPQPKEPQYLYVYKDIVDENGNSTTLVKISTVKINIDRYIGKIKLEVDDE